MSAEKLTTAEIVRLMTGGPVTKPCGCPDDGTSCLHGIPAGVNDRPEWSGVSREPVPVPTMQSDTPLPPELQPPPKLELIIAGLTLIEDRLITLGRNPTPSVLGIRQCAEDLRTARKALEDLL